MSRRGVIVLFIVFFFLVVGFTSTAFAMENDDNPIDKAFLKDWNEAMSTVEMNYVMGKYAEAWKGEMNHAATVIKGKYEFDEDKTHIDDYIEAYEKVAAAASRLEWLNWSDTTQNPKERYFGTGAGSASLSAKANIYKQATFNLINTYQGQERSNLDNNFRYSYIYSGKGAELEKIKEKMNKNTSPN